MIESNGPLPGENLISDRRNYAWHRPPEFDNLNDAMDFLLRRLEKKPVATNLLTLMEMGLPIRMIAQMMLIKGIESGRWTMDMALLLAGPLSHMLVIIARNSEIDFDLGITEDGALIPSVNIVERLSKPVNMGEISEDIQEEVIDANPAAGGFMGMVGEKSGETPVEPEVEEAGMEEEKLPNIGGFLKGAA